MFMTRTSIQTKESGGFALLITILVLGVIVAITLTIVELSIKQLKLAVDSTDSEIAFHAANAGLECARYTRRVSSGILESGNPVTFNCFNDTDTVNRLASLGFVTTGVGPTTGRVYRYKHSIEWGSAPRLRCTEMDMIVIVATSTVTIGGGGTDTLRTRINGFESDSKVCDAGERCTIMSVVGYSSACSATSSTGVLRREILLEL